MLFLDTIMRMRVVLADIPTFIKSVFAWNESFRVRMIILGPSARE
jgi:hypothetical protein